MNVQLIFSNYKPLTNFEDNIISMSNTYFIEAEAEIPFFMFDDAYAVKAGNMEVHMLFAEQWEVATQQEGSPDSVLISPEGEVVERFELFDGSNWYGDDVKDFILSHIE